MESAAWLGRFTFYVVDIQIRSCFLSRSNGELFLLVMIMSLLIEVASHHRHLTPGKQRRRP